MGLDILFIYMQIGCQAKHGGLSYRMQVCFLDKNIHRTELDLSLVKGTKFSRPPTAANLHNDVISIVRNYYD